MSRVVVTGGSIEEIARKVTEGIQEQMPTRAYRGANVLRNSSLTVLSGGRGGRKYGKHRASAPGEPPAVWSGTFRLSWKPRTYAFGTSYFSIIDSDVWYADWLENGTPGGQMAPRPHHDLIQQDALPQIVAIYDEPYNV